MKKKLLFFMLGASVALPGASTAQGTMLEEIIITATKRETNLLETPISITAVTSDSLSRNNITDISTLSQIVPGLQIRDTGGGGQGSVDINLRGVGNSVFTEIGEANVALNIDGIFTARPQAAMQLFNDVQRIEVARGPQGTLAGRNATVGAINIINNKPNLVDWEGNITLETGTESAKGITGLLNIPLVEDVFAVRLNAKTIEHDSPYKLIADNDTSAAAAPTPVQLPPNPNADLTPFYSLNFGDPADDGPGSHGSSDSKTARISTLWQPNDTLSWQFSLERYQNNALGAPFSFDCQRADCEASLTAEQISQARPFTSFLSLRGEMDQEIDNIRTTLEYEVPDVVGIKLNIGHTEMEQTLTQDLDAGAAIEIVFQDSAEVPWINENDTLDLQFTSRSPGPVQWTAGYFQFSEETSRSLGISFFPFGFSVFPNPNYEAENTAFYGDLQWDVTDKTQLFFGLRYSEDEKSNTGAGQYTFSANNFACPGALAGNPNNPNAGLPAPDVFLNTGIDLIINEPQCFFASTESPVKKDDYVDFRLGINHQITEDVMVYASVSSGHKAALQDVTVPLQRYFDQANPDPSSVLQLPVETEKLINYEIGSKGTLNDGRITYSAAMFFMDYSDKQEAQLFNFGDINCDFNGDGLNNDGPLVNGMPSPSAPGCDDISNFVIGQTPDLNDAIFPDQVEFAVVNADELEIFGLELEVGAQLGENGYLSGFFTYTDAEYKDFLFANTLGCPNPNLTNCLPHNVEGNQPRSSPKFTLNLTYSHTFNLANGSSIVPSVNAYYRGEYFLTPDNVTGVDPTLIVQTPQTADGLPAVNNAEGELFSDRQQPSTKLNFNVTWTSPSAKYAVDVFGTNITDEEVISNFRIDTAQTPLLTYEEPARYGARFRYNFF